VYGGTDGIITIFAVFAGVTGASLSAGVLFILGFATLLADAVSMSVSDYLSSTADGELQHTDKLKLMKEYDADPFTAQNRLRQIFRGKGFSDEETESLVKLVFPNREMVSDLLMHHAEETEESAHDARASALWTFIAFVSFGLVPLAVESALMNLADDVMGPSMKFWAGSLLTLCTLFGLGAIKASFVQGNAIKSGMQVMAVGGFAAFVAYYCAYILASIQTTTPEAAATGKLQLPKQ